MVEPVCVKLSSVEPKFDPVRYAKSSVQRLNRQTTSMSLIAFPSALLSYIRVPVNLPIKFHPLNRLIQFRPMSQSSASSGVIEADKSGDVLVQYVVLRRDLIDTWPLGSVVTQGCHASVSAICMNKDDALTLEYCSPSNIDSMHKVVFEFIGYDSY